MYVGNRISISILILTLVVSTLTHAHEHKVENVKTHIKGEVTYLGNAALMVESGDNKVLFDPFFHSHFNIYQLVPEEIENAIKQGVSPYNEITAIVISHAHGDHFAAQDVADYLHKFPHVKLYAPQQAVEELITLRMENSVQERIHGFDLALGDQPKQVIHDGLLIEAARIPHAGWPGRADVENLVFRVTIADKLTVMHLGDADPNNKHYVPFFSHWHKRKTHTAFPPYWFFLSSQGNAILENTLNAEKHIGVHVPVKIPQTLIDSKKSFFSQPGERVTLSDSGG